MSTKTLILLGTAAEHSLARTQHVQSVVSGKDLAEEDHRIINLARSDAREDRNPISSRSRHEIIMRSSGGKEDAFSTKDFDSSREVYRALCFSANPFVAASRG